MSSERHVLNMTEGRPLNLLVKFALPMLIGNLFQQVYNLADSIIVGKFVGADALASIGASSSVTFLFFALCNGIGNGGGIITSQYFGKGDDAMVKKSITNTAYIMFIFPLVVGIMAFILSRPILVLLKTPGNIMNDSLIYVRTMCVGLLFVSLYNFISSMLRALGDSKTPLYFLIAACLINVFLDIVFVYYFDLSVMGAGIATVISQLLSGAGCMIYAVKKNEYFDLKRQDFEFDIKLTKRIVKLGVPLSLQFALIAISCMALQSVVNSYGTVAVAAFTATSRIEQIVHQPYGTLGAALSTYTGQNYGANKHDRIVVGLKKGILLMVLFTAILVPVMQLIPGSIVGIFVDDPVVIEMGARALRINSIFYVVLGIIYVFRGNLNGYGDSFFALLNGIVEVFGRFTVPFILTAIPFIGLWGIWWSVGVVWFMSALSAVIRYIFFTRRLEKGEG